ncbi:MAG TPA: HEAT repeat domain-containing protein [Candidatus Ozemobacteraceae bacterium]|nr:HEAT repeat domain-containing protein [Candidatus Ozemobacteraceae bacterium]
MTHIPALADIFRALLAELAGEDFVLRRAALTALSRLRGEAAADVIYDQFRSDNLDEFLALAVARLDARKAARLLVQALHDSQLEVRLAAADGLSRLKSDEAVQVLTDAVEMYLAGPAIPAEERVLMSEESIAGAIRALARIATPLCQGLLRRMLLKEANPRLRATIVAAMTPLMSDALLPLMSGLLKDPDPRVRANVIEAIQTLKNPSTIAILQPYLYDPHQRVRANAVKAIWAYGDFEVSATLKEMLGSTDKRQRVSGFYAIGEIRLDAFERPLIAALRDADADVRRNAVIALRKIASGAPSTVKPALKIDIQTLLDDPEPAVRHECVIALGQLMGETCRPALLKRLEVEKAAGVRAQIIETLARLGVSDLLVRITPFIGDPEAQVVTAVLEVIGGMEKGVLGPVLIDAVRSCLRHADQKVRRKAASLLWKLGVRAVLDELRGWLAASDADGKKNALQCFGEICGAVSETGGELREIFDRELQAAVGQHRERAEQTRTTAAQADALKLWNDAAAEIQAGRGGTAIGLLERLIALIPGHLQGLMALGDLYQKDRDAARAEACYRKALAIQPNLPKAQYALGVLAHGKADWKAAVEALNTAIRLYPKLPQAYLLLADALEALQRPADAFRALRRLAEIAPSNGPVLLRLARAAFISGDIKTSIQALKQASSLGPLDYSGRFIMAFGAASGGNGAGAYRELIQLAALAVEHPGARSEAEFRILVSAALRLLRAAPAGG